MKKIIDRKFCVAPMMGYTTPYARNLYRILSKKTFLFSEMIATKTLIHSKNTQSVIANEKQNPIALQVGGSEYDDLKLSSKLAYELNYDEINLNVGCPSKAVQKGSFGACLMQDKKLVRNCLEAMQINKNIEVSIKCRIGLGKDLNYDFFEDFIDEILKSGVKLIYIHARNAILTGISPKGNRTIPPLNYDFVSKIKLKYPKITFILNGGIKTVEECLKLKQLTDGLMLGRAIYSDPYLLARLDHDIFSTPLPSRLDILEKYRSYMLEQLDKQVAMKHMIKHLLGYFTGTPGARHFRRYLSAHMFEGNANITLLDNALEASNVTNNLLEKVIS